MSSGTKDNLVLIGFLAFVIGWMCLFVWAGFRAGFQSGQLEAAKGNQMYELKPSFVEKGK